MTNFEKIILSAVSALIVAILILGTVIFRQQKTINALLGNAEGTSNQTAIQSSVKKKGTSLADLTKKFSGTIEKISGNKIEINVALADFSKPKNPEKMKNANEPVNLSSDDFETMNKKITVNTDEKTVFGKKPLAELKAGDMVSVDSDVSPYGSNAVLATKILYSGK